jgi:cobalamin-dependent methionine synthase I
MLDPITILSGFKLAQGAISAVKSALDTADDAGGVYSALDTLFRARDSAHKQLEKKANQKPKSKLRSIFSRRTGADENDDTSIAAVAASVLEQKKLEREILNLGIRIDNKFGLGTWDEILELREQKIKERDKQAEIDTQLELSDKLERQDKLEKYAMEGLKLLGVLAAGVGVVGYVLYSARCSGSTC